MISSPVRFKALPDVPTMREKGYNIDLGVRKFIFAPKGIPAEVKATLTAALQKATKDEVFLKNMQDGDLMVETMTPEQIRENIQATIPVVKKLLEDIAQKK